MGERAIIRPSTISKAARRRCGRPSRAVRRRACPSDRTKGLSEPTNAASPGSNSASPAWRSAPTAKAAGGRRAREMLRLPVRVRVGRGAGFDLCREGDELEVDGSYLDEFGFAGANGPLVEGARPRGASGTRSSASDCIEARPRADRGGAKKASCSTPEETPVDGTTQYQDGSFTYAMAEARGADPVPLNLARFAFPDFVTTPKSSSATIRRGVGRRGEVAFFNGEALWIELPARLGPSLRRARPSAAATAHPAEAQGTLHSPSSSRSSRPRCGGVRPTSSLRPGKTVYTLYNSPPPAPSGRRSPPRPRRRRLLTLLRRVEPAPASFRVLGKEAAIRFETARTTSAAPSWQEKSLTQRERREQRKARRGISLLAPSLRTAAKDRRIWQGNGRKEKRRWGRGLGPKKVETSSRQLPGLDPSLPSVFYSHPFPPFPASLLSVLGGEIRFGLS